MDARTRTRTRTAYHEAGHAVVARELGCTLVKLEINPEGGGCCTFDFPGAWRTTLADLRDELCHVLAGILCVELAGGRDWRTLSLDGLLLMETTEDLANRRDDYTFLVARFLRHEARDHDHSFDLADEWMDRELPAAAQRAVRILEERWADVTDLADRLFVKGTLTFAEAA